MPLSLSIDPLTGVALGVFRGSMDVEVGKQALLELWSLPDWNRRAAVWDIRLAVLDAPAEDIQVLARFILQNQPSPPPSRVAFVTADELHYGMMRMFESYREDPRTETRVLRDLEEAIAWASAAPSSETEAET